MQDIFRALFTPNHVAVFGVSSKRENVGRAILKNILRGGYRGVISPVHPTAKELEGVRACATLPAGVELAVIAVPAHAVPVVCAVCRETGVKGAVIISSGFSEGSVLEGQLRRAAQGLRLIGPNCLGVMCPGGDSPLNATFAPAMAIPGGVALYSQSGAVAISLVENARRRGIGFSAVVSGGNELDMGCGEFVRFWHTCDEVQAICLYLEGIRSGGSLFRLLGEVSQKKPVILLTGGLSDTGQLAARSHTAALATDRRVVAGACFQFGVTQVSSLEEMLDVLPILQQEPLPAGRGVAVITNGGGPGILFADAAERAGLRLPAFGAGALKHSELRLSEVNASDADTISGSEELFSHNPIDLGATPSARALTSALWTAAKSELHHSVVVLHTETALSKSSEIAGVVSHHPNPPHLVLLTPAADTASSSRPFRTISGVVAALSAAAFRSEYLARQGGEPPYTAQNHLLNSLENVLEELKGHDGWLSPPQVEQLLRLFELPVVRSRITELASLDSPRKPFLAEVGALSDVVGYPVVLKVARPYAVHKTELGYVVLGLQSRSAVERAAAELCSLVQARGESRIQLLLQSEVSDGVEMILGVTRDRNFGPVLSLGFGGVYAELLEDLQLALPPITTTQGKALLNRLTLAPLLAGYRGHPPVDTHALLTLVSRVSALSLLLPHLQELELNPVKVLPHGVTIVDARVRLGRTDDNESRRVRPF